MQKAATSIPFGKPIFGDEEKNAVLEVLNGPILVHGPKAKEFEKSFAAFTAAPIVAATLARAGAPVQSVQVEAVTTTGFTARRSSTAGTATLNWIAMGS